MYNSDLWHIYSRYTRFCMYLCMYVHKKQFMNSLKNLYLKISTDHVKLEYLFM